MSFHSTVICAGDRSVWRTSFGADGGRDHAAASIEQAIAALMDASSNVRRLEHFSVEMTNKLQPSLAVRIIQQTLQPLAERRRQAGGPVRIDETDLDHVAEVHTILVAPSQQLHPHESGKGNYLEFGGPLGFIERGA